MCISFLPLPTEVLGEYVLDPQKRQVAIIFYNFGLFLPAFSWSLAWFYASKNNRLIDANLQPSFVAHLTKQYALSNWLNVISIIVATLNASLGLAISISLTFFYLLPPKLPVYIDNIAKAGEHDGANFGSRAD